MHRARHFDNECRYGNVCESSLDLISLKVLMLRQTAFITKIIHGKINFTIANIKNQQHPIVLICVCSKNRINYSPGDIIHYF